MADRTQKLSIRLLRQGAQPSDAVRPDVVLDDWSKIDGAKIYAETVGGYTPQWANFLELSAEHKAELINNSAAGVVFIQVQERWFALSFGLGHVKLDSSRFEQDFGLRVVMNAVDPLLIRSADVRTPDENTLSRRSQTSRGSDQTAFALDVERDIVRGLAGKPKDPKFATRVSGADGLVMDRKAKLADLPAICTQAYEMFQRKDYEEHFKWVDQIRHVRDPDVIAALRIKLVTKLNAAIAGPGANDIHLAFPIIYDPEKGDRIQYKGFRSTLTFSDLDIVSYIEALSEKSKDNLVDEDLDRHIVHEVNDEGRDIGGKWPILDCIATEIEHEGNAYVLSSGRWYKIDAELAKSVTEFFDKAPKIDMPKAKAGENEETYNKRQRVENKDLICLDRKLVRPEGSITSIEICDFLSKSKELIHVKDKTSSSRLSHLFNQGTVSGRVLAMAPIARGKARTRIAEVEKETGQNGFEVLFSDSEAFNPPDFTVVYAVIATSGSKLPFFSLLTFRQAVRELRVSQYKYAFAWIAKAEAPGIKKKKVTSTKSK